MTAQGIRYVDGYPEPGCGAPTGVASNRCLLAEGHAGECDCQVPPMLAHVPHRGSDVEAWIKRERDAHGSPADDAWRVLDYLLDDYREHADTGVPLGEEVHEPEGTI